MLKRVAGRVGSVINGIGSNVGKVWDFAKNIPVFGDVIKRSPISGIVDTGLNIASVSRKSSFKTWRRKCWRSTQSRTENCSESGAF